MKNKIIDYGIVIFAVYISLHIYTSWKEINRQQFLLEDCAETIIKQRSLIDAQERYIHFLTTQGYGEGSGDSPIYPKRNNFGPI